MKKESIRNNRILGTLKGKIFTCALSAIMITSLGVADTFAESGVKTEEARRASIITTSSTSSAYDEAVSHAEKTAEALAEAEENLDSAKKNEKAAKNQLNDAKSDLSDAKKASETAKQKKTAAESKVETASTQYESAQKTYASSKAEYEEAKDKVDDLQESYDEAKEAYDRGSVGFFEEMGSDDALDVLENCRYSSYIKTKDNGSSESEYNNDATSLKNMKASIKWLKQFNNMRSELGLSQLKVSDYLMACAQADCDYSDQVIGHACQFNVGENLAWNFGSDPYIQWYDQEKEEFDNLVAEKYPESVGEDPWETYEEHSDLWSNDTGHYLNDINPTYKYTGFAVCSRGSNYPYTYGQVFYYSSVATTYTLSEYEQRFNDYVSDMEADIEKYETAKKEMNRKKSAYDNAGKNVSSKKAALEAAENAVEKADSALENCLEDEENANENVTSKQNKYDDALAALKEAQAAYETAREANDEALITVEDLESDDKDDDIDTNEDNNDVDANEDNDDIEDGENNEDIEDNENNDEMNEIWIDASELRSSYKYNGKHITPLVTVYDDENALDEGTDYKISYRNNKNVGSAALVIKMRGDYSGTYEYHFDIIPKGTSIKKIKAGRKAVKVTWKKQKTQTSGYQYCYSTNKKFRGAKKKKVSGTKHISAKIRHLRSRATVYVKVRTYKTVSGKTFYSRWSKVKKARVR